MNPNSFSASFSRMWAALGPALGDHLWQSTLFVVVAGLLTLILRKNQARARYWLWMSASVKFLVPFSWLVAIGKNLAWLRTSGGVNTGMYFVEEISQPFTQPAASAISHAAPRIASPSLIHLLPTLLAAIWLGGFVGVLFAWCIHWRRISAALRRSVPLQEGREVEALRRLERVTGIRQRVEMLLSRATLEPGIFGLSRPVLVWPEGISEHLDNAHLEAILAHELWHVRRRDNLAAAIHMTVEAIFWFHPLAWWLGARLVDERERACDEEVLELGSERRVYAESILKVCEFCVGSPLACVAGVTGSDLKKRMVHIMSEHVVRKLEFSKKLLLTAVGLAAIAAPVVLGLVDATPGRAQSQNEAASATVPAFQSFSIKPSAIESSTSATSAPTYAGGNRRMTQMMYGPKGFVANNVALKSIIQEAYGVLANQVSGGPDWLDTAKFDVEAKVDPAEGVKFGPGADHAKAELMLQTALAESTQLAVHHETKVLPIYALVVAEGGPKLQPSESAGLAGDQKKIGMRAKLAPEGGQVSEVDAQGIPTDDLARQLSMQLGVAVVDKTGLKGPFNFNLHWTREPNSGNPETENAASESALATALEEQLGLRLEPQKQPMDIVVIDHIEKPGEN